MGRISEEWKERKGKSRSKGRVRGSVPGRKGRRWNREVLISCVIMKRHGTALRKLPSDDTGDEGGRMGDREVMEIRVVREER